MVINYNTNKETSPARSIRSEEAKGAEQYNFDAFPSISRSEKLDRKSRDKIDKIMSRFNANRVNKVCKSKKQFLRLSMSEEFGDFDQLNGGLF